MPSYTSDFPYCRFPFYEWNPMQEKCLPYLTQDCNLVVSASVAAGKTALAEAILAYELSQRGRAVYVSPLKALSLEKFEEWGRHETLGQYRLLLMDGDHHHEKKEIESSQLILSTIEALHIASRNREEWIQISRALVFDEAHLFDNEKRGGISEAMMMDYSELVPSSRLVCLSGTLPNAKEIAQWLHTLNNKKTFYVSSNWRPTKLEKRVEVVDGYGRQLQTVVSGILESPDEKTLVFVHSKKTGEELMKRLRKEGVCCAFFRADLDPSKKEKILRDYRSQSSPLNVLVATSSLAMGVSL